MSKSFTITSFSAIGAKSIANIYKKMGYKLLSSTFDKKKEVYKSVFK